MGRKLEGAAEQFLLYSGAPGYDELYGTGRNRCVSPRPGRYHLNRNLIFAGFNVTRGNVAGERVFPSSRDDSKTAILCFDKHCNVLRQPRVVRVKPYHNLLQLVQMVPDGQGPKVSLIIRTNRNDRRVPIFTHEAQVLILMGHHVDPDLPHSVKANKSTARSDEYQRSHQQSKNYPDNFSHNLNTSETPPTLEVLFLLIFSASSFPIPEMR